MEVVVLVKYVPDPQSAHLVPPHWTVERAGAEGLLSELDEYAVEVALRTVETHGGSVTAVTMGPQPATAAVQAALQLGVGQGVHIVDPALSGSDTVATGLVLATAVERLHPDLVVTGMASTDAGTGVVPAMIAERLGWPQLTFADSVRIEGGTARITRDRERSTETVEARLPVVVAVTDRADPVRYPSFRSIVAARKKSILTWTLADLGLLPQQVGAVAARTAVDGVTPRPPRPAGRIVVDTGDGGVRLAEFLRTVDPR